MLVVASTVSQLAEGLGFAAAAMGVVGFLMHAPRALKGRDERSLREATAVGGLMGFAGATIVIVLSAMGVV
ncbi:MAG TPA: hypothetical protein VEQ41_02370 [Solirubrobacterales bacterium]|nr:hypothetical protein [Solirubrobacterales bacterium]